jgi:hypothetical protein
MICWYFLIKNFLQHWYIVSLPIQQMATYHRETPKVASLDTGFIACTKKFGNSYTGEKIKGIGTMHKSNAVPIFSDNEAKEIASMRR